VTESRNDITVNGGGTIAAGTYEVVTINGGGTVTGDLVCTTLKVNGMGTCKGSVKAATISVNGTGTFEGPVQAGDLTVNGDASVRAGLGVNNLVVKGNLTVDAGVAARSVEVKGFARIAGDLTADEVRGEGALEARDVKVTGGFDLSVYGASKVKSLDAARVVLRAPGSFGAMMFFTEKRFTAESIRGTEVWAEHTSANVVSAGNATIGRESRIGLVQYTGTYALVDNGVVTEARKV